MVNLGLLFALSAPVTALGLPVAFVLVALSRCIGMTDNIKPAVAQHHGGLTLLLQSSKCLNDGIDLLTTVGSVYATAQQRDACRRGRWQDKIHINAQRNKLAPDA